MAIADWIRDANEKRKQRLIAEGRRDAYMMGYEDRDKGKPRSRQPTAPTPMAITANPSEHPTL